MNPSSSSYSRIREVTNNVFGGRWSFIIDSLSFQPHSNRRNGDVDVVGLAVRPQRAVARQLSRAGQEGSRT